MSRDEFRARISDALRKRLAPNTPLRKVDLAKTFGLAVQTLDNWLSRYTQPDGYVLTQLIEFFDAGFANEIFGGDRVVVAKIADMQNFLSLREVNRSAKALAAIAELVALPEVA